MSPDPTKPPIDVEEQQTPFDQETAATQKNHDTLSDMTRDMEFFTTALMVTAGNFDRDPIIEYLKVHNLPGRDAPIAIDYARPFFEGLGTGVLLGRVINWNHRLYAIRRELWPDFRDTVAGMAWADQRQRTYTRALFHELEIVDETLMHKKGEILSGLPMITITVFACSSNLAFNYIAPALRPPVTRAFAVRQDPRPDMIIEADRVLGPPLSPETLSRHRKP